MKKVIAIMMVFALACSGAAYAATSTATTSTTSSATEYTAFDKLGRGLANLADAVVEIPGTMIRETNENGAASGWTNGVFNGIINTVKRAAVGVYEVASFPIPAPAGYEPILDDPKYLASE